MAVGVLTRLKRTEHPAGRLPAAARPWTPPPGLARARGPPPDRPSPSRVLAGSGAPHRRRAEAAGRLAQHGPDRRRGPPGPRAPAAAARTRAWPTCSASTSSARCPSGRDRAARRNAPCAPAGRRAAAHHTRPREADRDLPRREPVVGRDEYTRFLDAQTGKPHATPCQLFNDCVRLWGIRHTYDEEDLTSSCAAAGFAEIERVETGESRRPALRGLERHGEPWVNQAEASASKRR